MFTQTILLRELLVVALGNEIVFGISFTHWLTGICFGAVIGGLISDKLRNPVSFLVVSIQLLCIIAPVLIYSIRLFYRVTGTSAGTYIGFFDFFIHASWMIVPFSFFIGFTFPLASRLVSDINQQGHRTKSHITRLYIYEAVGFLAGGILFTFFFSGKSNPFLILAIFSIPLIWWTITIPGRSHLKFISMGLLLVLGLGFIPPGYWGINNSTIQKRWSSRSNVPLIISADSKYQNLSLGKNEDQFSLFSNGQLSVIFPERNDNMKLAAHLFCQHPNPENILVIGEAISGLGEHLLKYNPRSIHSVEIDPVLIQLISSYLPSKLSDKRFSQVIQDERYYVKKYSKKSHLPLFDLVFLNISEPATLLLNRFYTRDFFEDIHKILSSDGVLALRITSSENYAAGFVSEYTASIYHTIKSVFPHLVVAPGEQNFFFASPSPASISDSPQILEGRYDRSGVVPRRLGMLFYSLYPQEKTRFINQALDQAKNIRINSDNTPVATFYFNKILGWYSGNDLDKFFSFFKWLNPKNVILFLLFVVLGRIFYLLSGLSKKKKREETLKLHVLIAVTVVGFSGMAMELFYIYTFQNDFGYIYQFIGFIIALFMLGLPIGALLAGKITSKPDKMNKNIVTLLIILLILGAVILSFPFLHTLFVQLLLKKILTLMAAVLTGILVGSVFPTALTILLGKKNPGGSTGWIDAADHGGAALGALISGTILLPVLGLTGSCLFMSGILLLSCLLLATHLLRKFNIKK